MARTPYGVRVEGVDVVMTLGDKACRMDYTTALKLAVFLYHSGKMAKKAAGDESRRIIGIADLTDANADELEAQFNRDRTAVFAKV
jgi:uncharacterized protein YqiB (DUF1249 family)